MFAARVCFNSVNTLHATLRARVFDFGAHTAC